VKVLVVVAAFLIMGGNVMSFRVYNLAGNDVIVKAAFSSDENADKLFFALV
jgi:hypothetical protein